MIPHLRLAIRFPLLRLIHWLFEGTPAAGALVNHTIDDQKGDSVSHALPSFFPVPWPAGQTCSGCRLHPGIIDPTQAFQGTWSDITYDGHPTTPACSVQVNFTGSAVYVYNIMVQAIAPGAAIATTNLTFHIDDELVGAFYQQPTNIPSNESTQVSYNMLVYGNTSLPHGPHSLLMATFDSVAANILFDYVVYTTDNGAQPPPESASSAAPSESSPSPPSSPPSVQPSSTTASPSPASSVWDAQVSTPTSSMASLSRSPSLSSSLAGNASPAPPPQALSSAVPSRSSSELSTSSPPASTVSIPTSPSSTVASRNPPFNTATVVGSTVGGTVAIVFALLVCLFRRRRSERRRRCISSKGEHRTGDSDAVTPFAFGAEVPGSPETRHLALWHAANGSFSSSKLLLEASESSVDTTDTNSDVAVRNERLAQLMRQTQLDELRATRNTASGVTGVVPEPSPAEQNMSSELSALGNEASALRAEGGEQLSMALEVPPTCGG